MSDLQRKSRLACNFSRTWSTCDSEIRKAGNNSSHMNSPVLDIQETDILEPCHSQNNVSIQRSNTVKQSTPSFEKECVSDAVCDGTRTRKLEKADGSSNPVKGWARWTSENAPSFEEVKDDNLALLFNNLGHKRRSFLSDNMCRRVCSSQENDRKSRNKTMKAEPDMPLINMMNTESGHDAVQTAADSTDGIFKGNTSDTGHSNTPGSQGRDVRQNNLNTVDDSQGFNFPRRTLYNNEQADKEPGSIATYSPFGTPDLLEEFRSTVALCSRTGRFNDLMSDSSTDSSFGSNMKTCQTFLQDVPPLLQDEVKHVLADSKDVLKLLPTQSHDEGVVTQNTDTFENDCGLLEKMNNISLHDPQDSTLNHQDYVRTPPSQLPPELDAVRKEVSMLQTVETGWTPLLCSDKPTGQECCYNTKTNTNSGKSSTPSPGTGSLHPADTAPFPEDEDNEHVDLTASEPLTELLTDHTQIETQETFTSLPSLEDAERYCSVTQSTVTDESMQSALTSLSEEKIPFGRYLSEPGMQASETCGTGSVTIEDICDDNSSQFLSARQSGSFRGQKPVIPIEDQEEICSLLGSLSRSGVVGKVKEHSMVLHQGDDTVLEEVKQSHELALQKSTGVRSCKSDGGNGVGIAVSNSKDVQAVGNFHYNKQVLRVSINETTKNIKSQVKRELSASRRLFVKTRAYGVVADVLEGEPIVFITGPSGVGKKMIAQELLREYEERYQFEPLILKNVSEMRMMINAEIKQAILLTHVFGVFELDQKKFDEFVEYFEIFEACADESKKFIFTSTGSVFQRGSVWLSMRKRFKKELVIDLLQLEMFNSVEKRMILHSHLKEMKITIPEELIEKIARCDSSHMFPKHCQIFSKFQQLHNPKSALEFFQRPVLYHKGIIDNIAQRNDKRPFAVLLLTMVFGKLCDSFLKEGNHPDEDKAEKYLSAIGCLDKTSISSLKPVAESMLGTHLKRFEESYVFIDECLYDAVACVFGSRYPKQLLQICSLEFLCNKVHVAKTQEASCGDEKILLEEEQFEYLSERFVCELRNGNTYTVGSHIAFIHTPFITAFVKYCEKLDDFKSLILSKDKRHGFTFLYWSSWNPDEHLFKWILREYKKLKTGFSSKDTVTIAKACCVSGNVKVLTVLFKVLKKERVLSMVKSTEKTPLAVPCSLTMSDEVQEPATGIVSSSGMLHMACFHGYLQIVELLVSEFKSPVDAPDSHGELPLNIAAKQGHVDIVRYLIANGINLKRVKSNKNTVMHDACENGQTEVVSVLLEACPNLIHVPGEEPDLSYPIHLATMSKCFKLVQNLLQKDANPEQLDSRRNTAFHTACMKAGNLRMLKTLNPSAKQINTVNKRGKTCLHVACEFGGAPMVDFLITKGANVNAVDFRNQTPLHIACENNKKNTVEKLLADKRIDLFVLDIQGKPALQLTSSRLIQRLLREQITKSETSQHF